jgi:phage baseplate assembly protein gpV
MVANPATFDTIVVAFLDGNQTPVLEQQAGWTVDGMEYKVRIDCAAKAVDYRGMVKSSG